MEHVFGHRTCACNLVFIISELLHDVETVHWSKMRDTGQAFFSQLLFQSLDISAYFLRIDAQQVQVMGAVSVCRVGFFRHDSGFFGKNAVHVFCSLLTGGYYPVEAFHLSDKTKPLYFHGGVIARNLGFAKTVGQRCYVVQPVLYLFRKIKTEELQKFTMLRCVKIAPLGFPVEPEV